MKRLIIILLFLFPIWGMSQYSPSIRIMNGTKVIIKNCSISYNGVINVNSGALLVVCKNVRIKGRIRVFINANTIWKREVSIRYENTSNINYCK